MHYCAGSGSSAPCWHVWRRYGILVLAVEVLGGLAMLPYGLCLTLRVTNNDLPPPDEKGQVRRRWQLGDCRLLLVRVLVAGALTCCCGKQRHAMGSTQALAAAPCAALQVHTSLGYHIRVVVPCYKEPLDVIQKTVAAALVAPIPVGCSRTGGPRWQPAGVLCLPSLCAAVR